MEMETARLVFRYRVVLGFFLAGLVASGVTAFPLVTELGWLTRVVESSGWVATDGSSPLLGWLQRVHGGLVDVAARYPWMAYGTDWLAFAHLVIAMFFVGPWLDPVSGRSVLRTGVVACVAVIPLALICGEIRGIPFYWRLIDCSFGVFGVLPLLYCLRLRERIAAAGSR